MTLGGPWVWGARCAGRIPTPVPIGAEAKELVIGTKSMDVLENGS